MYRSTGSRFIKQSSHLFVCWNYLCLIFTGKPLLGDGVVAEKCSVMQSASLQTSVHILELKAVNLYRWESSPGQELNVCKRENL